METIKDHISTVNSFFYSIKLILGGKYRAEHTSSDQNVIDFDIPTIADDKINRRKDIKAIGSDMKKVLKEKELELCNK